MQALGRRAAPAAAPPERARGEPTPSPYAAVYHERHELPANPTLQNALVGLIKKELVGRGEEASTVIIEPFLARWLEREQEDYGVAARLRA